MNAIVKRFALYIPQIQKVITERDVLKIENDSLRTEKNALTNQLDKLKAENDNMKGSSQQSNSKFWKYSIPNLNFRKDGPLLSGDSYIINEVWFKKIYSKNLSINYETIVDIGAHIGSFTVLAAFNCPNAKVWSYEPVRSNYDLLTNNIVDNKIDDRVIAYNLGVCKENGPRIIFKDNISTGGGSMFWGDERPDKETANCITLDRVFSDNNLTNIDFLKLDCEGAEFEILYNSQHLLNKIGRISMEMHGDGVQLENYLMSCGFTIESRDSFINNNIYHLDIVKKEKVNPGICVYTLHSNSLI